MNKKYHVRLLSLLTPFLVATLLFILLRFLFTSLLLFESLLISTSVSLILSNVFLFRKNLKKDVDLYTLAISASLSALMFFSVGFSCIMTVDRSKSFYVISWIHDLQPVKSNVLESAIRNKYGEYDKSYINQRIKEQATRKIIISDKDEYRLSKIGQFYWGYASLISKIFNLQGWNQNKIMKAM